MSSILSRDWDSLLDKLTRIVYVLESLQIFANR